VLRLLWADPQYMRFPPGADSGELEAAVIQHQTRVWMTEGAFVGGPFIVLLPVAFCAAMLAQAQMALLIALPSSSP
jgi:hypothetical protein